MTLAVVILAAGKGTRMKSALPKVLHPLAGAPLVHPLLDLDLRDRDARRAAVDDGADRRPVAEA